MPVDPLQIARDPRLGRGFGEVGENARDPVGVLDDPRLGPGQLLAGEVMRRDSRPQAFRAIEPRAGQREKLAEPPLQPRQVPAAADIREQPDPALGHGETGVLGGDPVWAGQGDAHPAAHGDAIHEGHHGLVIGEQLVVELVFVVEELATGLAAIVERGIAQHADIAPGAKAAPLGMVEDYRLHRSVVRPAGQRRADRVAHVERERVQRLGPVERNMPDLAVRMDVDVVAQIALR